MRNEKGFSLVEVLVALALLGIIGAAFLSGLATASKSILIADERTTAESLARSQMEYVKKQDYSTTNVDWNYTVTDLERISLDPPDWWDDTGSPGNPPLLSPNYAGYSVEASADEDDVDVGLQVISIVIKRYQRRGAK